MATPDTKTPSAKRRILVAELASQGVSASAIASRLGVTRQRVHQIGKEFGVKFKRPDHVHSPRHLAERHARRDARRERLTTECEGMTRTEAAKHLGVCIETVRTDAKAAGFKLAPARPETTKERALHSTA